MKRVLVTGLLLVATSASADHVWRLWCGRPPTKRGAVDTSDECWQHVVINEPAVRSSPGRRGPMLRPIDQRPPHRPIARLDRDVHSRRSHIIPRSCARSVCSRSTHCVTSRSRASG